MVGVAIRNTRGRPSLASSKKLSYSTILNIVIAVTTYFLGYLTGISKPISHKANCIHVISSVLRKGEHDTLSADEARQMEDTIKSVVEERMAKAYTDCFGKFNLKILLYFMQIQDEINADKKLEPVSQCLFRQLSSALELESDGRSLVLDDSEKRSIELFMASVVKNRLTEEIKNRDSETETKSSEQTESKIFPKGVANFASGAVTTNKEDFLKAFDYGYPQDQYGISDSSKEVLILYSGQQYIPTNVDASTSRSIPFTNDPVAATSKCHEMSVVVADTPCLVIMNGYKSYHVQRWLRIEGNLKHVSRGLHSNGYDDFKTPMLSQTNRHWVKLKKYFDSLDQAVRELRPITERIKVNNTIIVMVCNFGQSALLINFACSSRARRFDISNLLVFATDKETLELSQSLGLSAYYDDRNFDGLPAGAAKRYADLTFMAMIMPRLSVSS